MNIPVILSQKTSLLGGNSNMSRSNDLHRESSEGVSVLSTNQNSQQEKSNVKMYEGLNVKTTNQHINKIQRQELLSCLTRTYAIIVSRWGGYARDIINVPATKPTVKVMERPDYSITPLLNVLCFSTSYLNISWALMQSNDALIGDLRDIVDVKKR
jgi:hypothetical protein